MKILLIEDDTTTASFILKGLKQEGYVADHAPDGETGLHLATTESYDVGIFDLMVPKIDGLTLITELRSRQIKFPIIILSAKSAVSDRVKGLQAGSDDYMVKPFSFIELNARLQALMRRNVSVVDQTRLQIGEITVDSERRKVLVKDTVIDMQPREFILLEYLLKNQGRVLSKTMIMENVWDYNFDPNTNVVEAKISKLRSKLGKVTEKNYIHTVHGLGYVCEDRD